MEDSPSLMYFPPGSSSCSSSGAVSANSSSNNNNNINNNNNNNNNNQGDDYNERSGSDSRRSYDLLMYDASILPSPHTYHQQNNQHPHHPILLSDEDQLSSAAHAAAVALSESDALVDSAHYPLSHGINTSVDTNASAVITITSNATHTLDQNYHDALSSRATPNDISNLDSSLLHVQSHALQPHHHHQQQHHMFLEPSPHPYTHHSENTLNSMEHHLHQLHPPPPPPPLEAPVCCICGQGDDEGRPMLRFLPVERDNATASAAPSVVSFSQDLALHIFCGKTASILPSVNRPDLEILTKAGLKNKHGIGPEVNAALARTRCAVLLQEGTKEKHYFLVREFEAHLAAIRHTHITFQNDIQDPFSTIPDLPIEFAPLNSQKQSISSSSHRQSRHRHKNTNSPPLSTMDFRLDSLESPSSMPLSQKPSPPYKAAAGNKHKPGRRYSSHNKTKHNNNNNNDHDILNHEIHMSMNSIIHDYNPVNDILDDEHDIHDEDINIDDVHLDNNDDEEELLPPQATMNEPGPDGRMKCACGGTHWPMGTPRGVQSWRNHVLTKRHQKWMEEQDMIGAV
jgi:hypothetical protein